MKLYISKILLKDVFFLLRHIVLFSVINIFFYYFMNIFVYNLLVNNLANFVNANIKSDYIFAENIFLVVVNVFKIIFIFSIYTIAMNNDVESIDNDFILYINEFFLSSFQSITSSLAFLFLSVFSLLGGITFLIFFNLCCFYLPYSMIRFNEGGKKNSPIQSLSNSFKLTKAFRLKLIICNSIIFTSIIFLILIIPSEFYLYTFNISYILKIILYNLFLIHILTTFFELEKMKNKVLEEIRFKEVENNHFRIKARSDV